MVSAKEQQTMNVGMYSGVSGMRLGQDYQNIVTENLSMQAVPGFKRSLPVFSTDAQAPTGSGSTNDTASGNPAAVHMNRTIDFTQGTMQPTGNQYDVAIRGNAFFKVREADGTTTYTRNGSFGLSPKGQLHTTDGAAVLGNAGAPITIDSTKGAAVTIAKDGTISQGGAVVGSLGVVHFDQPSTALQPGAYGRFIATKSSDAKSGLDKNDTIIQGNVEQGNSNPVEEMANMIQAVRLYEANQKSIQAADDNQNQLITSLGQRPQA